MTQFILMRDKSSRGTWMFVLILNDNLRGEFPHDKETNENNGFIECIRNKVWIENIESKMTSQFMYV